MKRNTTYFNISERRIFLRLIDVLVIIASIYLSYIFLEFYFFDFLNTLIFYWLLLFIFYFLVFGEIFQLYNLTICHNRYLVLKSITITVFSTILLYILTPYITPELPSNRFQILSLFSIVSISVLLWRFAYITFISSPKYFKNVIFIGESSRIESMLKKVDKDSFHHIVAYFSDKEIEGVKGFKNIVNISNDDSIHKSFVSEVIVSKENLSDEIITFLNEKLIDLFKKGINIINCSKFSEQLTARIPKEYLTYNFYDNFNYSENINSRLYLFGVRFLDIFLSLLGVLLLSVFLPFIATGNCIGNWGSLFYTQLRIGKNGKPFKIYKLRSMVENAESIGPVWSKKDDIRITRFGRFLRRTRLDEFPQFFNILKGDMSLIGPRPERPKFVKYLEQQNPFYGIRHIVRPGLTGWAQVNYPYANTKEEQEVKLCYDLYYIKERNILLDFKILIKTITTVLYLRGQ